MTTEYSVSVNDWQDEKWSFVGRYVFVDSCTHKTQDKDRNEENRETDARYSGWCEECDISEDSGKPMMNYAYPLFDLPSDEKIVEIHQRTNLTVVENTETEEYFLALCGGGMDLSQSIGLAYIIAQGWIPFTLASEITKQPHLNVGEKDWLIVAKECINRMTIHKQSLNYTIKEWKREVKEYKESKKAVK